MESIKVMGVSYTEATKRAGSLFIDHIKQLIESDIEESGGGEPRIHDGRPLEARTMNMIRIELNRTGILEAECVRDHTGGRTTEIKEMSQSEGDEALTILRAIPSKAKK